MSQVDAFLFDLVPRLVPGLCEKFPTLDPEDVSQQAWAGCLEHKDQLGELLDEGSAAKAKNDAKQWATKAVLGMYREQDRHDRVLKAQEAGYEAEDEKFYSTGMLRVLIPAYLDNGITPKPPKGRELTPPSGGDPAEGGNWMVMMMDVDTAFWAVKSHHRNILTRYFAYPKHDRPGDTGFTHEQIAGRLGIPPETLKKRLEKALRAVQRELGGPGPG